MQQFCGGQGDRYDSISCRCRGCNARCLRRSPWSSRAGPQLRTAGPQLRAPNLSGHFRTSTANSTSQWALPGLNCELRISVPDLNCELHISVGTARPQLRAPHLSGHCRASTELRISVGTAGPQLRAPDLSGHCQTSTVSARSQWAQAVPMSERMSE